MNRNVTSNFTLSVILLKTSESLQTEFTAVAQLAEGQLFKNTTTTNTTTTTTTTTTTNNNNNNNNNNMNIARCSVWV